MRALPLAWTLLIVTQWTSVLGSDVFLLQEPVKVIYPKIGGTETIECDCHNITCDSVFWFFTNFEIAQMKFLGRCNNANRDNYGDNVDESKFKITKKGTSSFSLRITNLNKADTGIYSCVVKERKTEVWRSGFLLLPGVSPPTQPPKTQTKPPVKTDCDCPELEQGCGSMVLWPLVGLIGTLALALICILYYFSRLPKKCRHHFVKKR